MESRSVVCNFFSVAMGGAIMSYIMLKAIGQCAQWCNGFR